MHAVGVWVGGSRSKLTARALPSGLPTNEQVAKEEAQHSPLLWLKPRRHTEQLASHQRSEHYQNQLKTEPEIQLCSPTTHAASLHCSWSTLSLVHAAVRSPCDQNML